MYLFVLKRGFSSRLAAVLILSLSTVLLTSNLLYGQDKRPPQGTNSIANVIAGSVENAIFPILGIKLKAKLDTGAKTSAINAEGYTTFKRKGKRWARFRLTEKSGRQVDVERPISRMITIRRAGVPKVTRPVIRLLVCIGGLTKKAEFRLAYRRHMNYQVLIGRRFLSGRLLVSSGNTFLLNRTCKNPKKHNPSN